MEQQQEGQQGYISLVPDRMHPRDAYRLMVSMVVPRPIAWVSSLGADGTRNLAPFSFFNAVGGTPPTIMFSVGQREGRPKDTLRNVQETGEFVLHIVSYDLAERMNVTSGEYGYGFDEFNAAGLEVLPSVDVRPPRLAEAPIAMEARLSQLIPVNDTRYTMVLGRVVRYHIREGLIGENGLVSAEKLEPVARLGGDDYAVVRSVFSMTRPRVEPQTP